MVKECAGVILIWDGVGCRVKDGMILESLGFWEALFIISSWWLKGEKSSWLRKRELESLTLHLESICKRFGIQHKRQREEGKFQVLWNKICRI